MRNNSFLNLEDLNEANNCRCPLILEMPVIVI